MSKPPKLSLAAIVASASPPARPLAARPQGAEIVALALAPPAPKPGTATLKQRAR
ncbi:MAG: hypothetical protein INR63_20820, partial [Actinomycetospora chiangmaiensis]|nr:hypothetical protein [Actinomycetospora chiangmaiensis]